MITAVDTNILLDILIPGAQHGDSSEKALLRSLEHGAVIICEAVYAELAAHFPSQEELDKFLAETGIRLQSSNQKVLYLAGKIWRKFIQNRTDSLICPSCGSSQTHSCQSCGTRFSFRQHVMADFLVGAHALVEADCLLSRDRGYFRTYFPQLKVI